MNKHVGNASGVDGGMDFCVISITNINVVGRCRLTAIMHVC